MTDHPEYRGLLAAVLATPADDLPRLVLADWLEENGDPERAEFIRAQCELDRHPHAARIRADMFTDAEGVRPEWQDGLASARRMRELWPAVSAVIAGTLGAGAVGRYTGDGDCIVIHGQSVVFEVRRGFPSAVRCRLDRWIGTGPRLVREHPLERVTLTDRECAGWGARWDATPGQEGEIFASALSNLLPWSVASRLEGGVRVQVPARLGPQRHTWRYYSTQEAAAALSAAVIAWAKDQLPGG